MSERRRLIDSGWRLTVPKDIRDQLGWEKGTPVCVSWDGWRIHIKSPHGCLGCPDSSRMGALGKIVIPPKVRAEANLYPGQVLTFTVDKDKVLAYSGPAQVRCVACGSELNVKMVLPNVYLCQRCREELSSKALSAR